MPLPPPVIDLAARLWKRLHGPAQWRLLWLQNPTFIVGLTGAVLDERGRVLVCRHRFWKDDPWGLPSGYAKRGETLEDAFAREVREETGIEVRDVEITGVHSGFRLRLEVTLKARAVDGFEPQVDGIEVVEARFVELTALPRLRPSQRRAVALV